MSTGADYSQKSALQKNADGAKMLTYDELAQELGMPRGTLSRKIAEHNKRREESLPELKPDLVEPHHGYTKHFFKAGREAEILAALQSTTRRRGRRATPGKENGQ